MSMLGSETKSRRDFQDPSADFLTVDVERPQHRQPESTRLAPTNTSDQAVSQAPFISVSPLPTQPPPAQESPTWPFEAESRTHSRQPPNHRQSSSSKTRTRQQQFDRFDHLITQQMAKHAPGFIQSSLGLIFIWFGTLKFFSGASPAEALVTETSEKFFDLIGIGIPVKLAIFLLAVWEVSIGVAMLFDMFKRTAVWMLLLHMPSTTLPLFLLPHLVWNQFPFELTLEGQYIIKNLVLIGGALAIGATVRDKQPIEDYSK